MTWTGDILFPVNNSSTIDELIKQAILDVTRVAEHLSFK
jgi:hypothetical protein